MRCFLWSLGAVAFGLGVSTYAPAQDYEQPPIEYSRGTPDNAVSRLTKRLEAGSVRLEHEEHFGYLRGLLKQLDVPESSQTLVFSKTSLQRDRIDPERPRSIFFNDEIYVGFCQQGEVLEISVADPQLGGVFYTMPQQSSARPIPLRQTESCLMCHASGNTEGVPGHLVRSVFPDDDGVPILSAGSYRTDHTSPLEERWGGWYVSGALGRQPHFGNTTYRDANRTPERGAERLDSPPLDRWIDTRHYLRPHSDLVALMVLEHQVQGHNLLARANFETRAALHMEVTLNRELGEPPTHRWNSTTVRIRSAGEALVKYLLFSGEAPLAAPLSGASSFAEEFTARGPFDSQRRTLREFDLRRRLFRYPLSYLVYTPAFDALPPEMRDYVYGRLAEVLSGRDTSEPFAHLTAADRQAVVEILRATKPGLPADFPAARTAPAEAPERAPERVGTTSSDRLGAGSRVE